MTSTTLPASASETANLRRGAPVFLGLGVLMVIMGTFAMGWACLATLTVATVWIFGAVLIAGGVVAIVGALRSHSQRGGRLLHLLMGVLYLLVGAMFMNEPKESALRLTLIIALFLMVGGLLRVVFALAESFPGRAWVMLNGVISFALGIMIYNGLPDSAYWVIGLFIAIELLFNGWAWIALGLAARGMGKTAKA